MSTENLEQSGEQNRKSEHEYPENIGNHLRNIRKKRGIEVGDAARETKISAGTIIAIEDQDYSVLPANTFTRGLVTLYAEFLEEDGKKIAELFIKARNEIPPTPDRKHKNKEPGNLLKPKKYAERTNFPPAAVAGIVLLIAILLLVALLNYTSWNPLRTTLTKPTSENLSIPPSESAYPTNPQHPSQVEPQDQDTKQATEPPIGEDSASKPDDTLPPPEEEENEPITTPLTEPDNIDADPETVIADEKNVTENEPEPPLVSELAAEEEVSPSTNLADISDMTDATDMAPPTGPKFVLSITFEKDTWVDISQDENPQIRHIADKGDTRTIKADKWIKLSFAKPESARIRLNGEEIAFPRRVDENGHSFLQIPEDLPGR